MTWPRDIDAYLSKRFFNPSQPGSYTSSSKLHKVIKNEGKYDISLSRINDWAVKNDILSLHKQVRQTQPKYRRIIAPSINHMIDADLMVLSGNRFKIANNGYSYILVTIDVFSRFCRAEAVKSKGSADMCAAFESIFDTMAEQKLSSSSPEAGADLKDVQNEGSKDSPILPLYIRSDNGIEFTNSKVQKLFDRKGIQHIRSSGDFKANYSEALIKNLKKRLFQYFQTHSTYTYIDVLPEIVRSYNNTFHSSIDMTPASVTDQNTQQLWDYQYVTQNTKDLDKLFVSAYNSSLSRSKKKYKFSIGDKVRISYRRAKVFHRAYDQQFSSEIFTITDRKLSDGIFLYYLRDYSGEPIKGAFYTNQLTPVTFDPGALFKIDEVIKTRTLSKGRKKISESLVSYEGWPAKYNQWIPTSSLKTIGKGKGKRG